MTTYPTTTLPATSRALVLDHLATHLITELADVHLDAIGTGGNCVALCARDHRTEDGWSPILITDGDHGVSFDTTGTILISLTDPDDLDQWWEYAATPLTVRRLSRALRQAIADPTTTTTVLRCLGMRPAAAG